MAVEAYDARLIIYQTLFDIPAQVLMYDLYRSVNSEENKALTYGVMALVNLGSKFISLKGGQLVYSALHGNVAPTDGEYYTSPITEHTYNVAFERYKHNVQSSESKNPLDQYLSNSTAYSKRYMDLAFMAEFARISYSTLSANTQNPILAIAYGLTQPLCVVLEDNGAFRD